MASRGNATGVKSDARAQRENSCMWVSEKLLAQQELLYVRLLD